jgi:hypothetical protein
MPLREKSKRRRVKKGERVGKRREKKEKAALRSWNFWPKPELEPEYRSFGSGSGSAKVVNKNKYSY